MICIRFLIATPKQQYLINEIHVIHKHTDFQEEEPLRMEAKEHLGKLLVPGTFFSSRYTKVTFYWVHNRFPILESEQHFSSRCIREPYE